ncbi:MAG: NrfD/PsrC family molybdoenzyme membrane anchor subunit [Gemmatimonadota bacterium]
MTPDTFFTASPHWTWFIIPYFFVGGIAGGAYFFASLLQWFGRPEDRPVIRTGYSLAFWGAILSGALLTLDLGKPLRFWHMLFASENFPQLAFKAWSPISFGAWAILLFGACAAISWYVTRVPDGPPKGGVLLAKSVAALGFLLGFFIAGYTGVLLSVTNRPIWADSPWLGALFLVSAASTGSAALTLLASGASERTIRWLQSFDTQALVVELVLLIVFVASLGSVARVWLGFWGLVLLVGVFWTGILWPLRLHFKPAIAGGGFRNPALMVLLGGFLLRVTVLLASNSIAVHRVAGTP